MSTEHTASHAGSTNHRRPVRVGTIVWGLVIIALAVLVILARVAGIQLDPTQVFIGLLLGSGAALVIGGVLSLTRKP